MISCDYVPERSLKLLLLEDNDTWMYFVSMNVFFMEYQTNQ